MKLSTLLETIDPIRIGSVKADRQEQRAKERNNDYQPDALGSRLYRSDPDPEIGSIHCRAQDVQPGGLFVALKGQRADGHDFIEEALARGAAAVVTQNPAGTPRVNGGNDSPPRDDPISVQVTDTRAALASMAARFYENPSERLTLIGITGTNGKTTTSYLIESILSTAGLAVGVIGTINYRYAGQTFTNPMTTPESLDLQRILAEMVRARVTHVVLEASSHAIELQRIKNCRFAVGVFTNLSQDHLDFHGDMQSYWNTKKRLFTEYLNAGRPRASTTAVINCADAKGRELAAMLPMRVLTTGRTPDCLITASATHCDLSGIHGNITTPAGHFDFHSRLVGNHNLENILCATGVGLALNLPLNVIPAGLQRVAAVPGRLEQIPNATGRHVYVDYAHTPDALENVLSALKAVTSDRIICVFGCGGDRDNAKRPLMGEIAARLCDLAVITSDNPRTEAPLAIIDQIVSGIKRAQTYPYTLAELDADWTARGFVIEPDRHRAIRLGIHLTRRGDTVLIAGKGHETYQIIGATRIAFDDRQEAAQALASVAN
ncbi:MAG: UDP-N-acetylmuramoyl-L-alanyl-D-glutamate--2,6-diaminopimelate ligase [Desulfobacterales bacterium]|nr:MAG: UDP-N-acetylmuramoyl-L-alanyl-D-glutamate--2,6-diaminopimelate ligase [Desulfobacterales bacterium]